MGGYNGSTVFSSIYGLNFSNETGGLIGATLDQNRAYGVGVSSAVDGYCMGGYNVSPRLSSIYGLNFFNETGGLIGATLDQCRVGGAGIQGVD